MALAPEDSLEVGTARLPGSGVTGPRREVDRTPFSTGRRLVFHGLLAVGLVWGLVRGIRSTSGRPDS